MNTWEDRKKKNEEYEKQLLAEHAKIMAVEKARDLTQQLASFRNDRILSNLLNHQSEKDRTEATRQEPSVLKKLAEDMARKRMGLPIQGNTLLPSHPSAAAASENEVISNLHPELVQKVYDYQAQSEAAEKMQLTPGAYKDFQNTDALFLFRNGQKYTAKQVQEMAAAHRPDAYSRVKEELNAAGVSAEKFMEYVHQKNGKEYVEQKRELDTRIAQKYPVTASVASILHAPFKIGGIVDAGRVALSNALTGEEKPLDLSDPLYDFSLFQSNVRTKVSDDIGNKVGSFLYNTGMSMGDFVSLLPMAALPGGQMAIGTIFAGSAATDTAIDITNRGGTSKQALLGGVAAGAAEALFEKFSLDAILKSGKVTGISSFLKNILKGAMVEGSEEAATEITNIISDQVVMGEKSTYSLRVKDYIKSGMSREDAQKQARMDLLGQVGTAFAGGALSGTAIHGVNSGMDAIQNKAYGKQVLQNDDIREAIRTGFEAKENSTAYQLAVELSQKMVNKERLSPYKVGAMVMDAQQDRSGTPEESMPVQAPDAVSTAAVQNLQNSTYPVRAAGVQANKATGGTPVQFASNQNARVNGLNRVTDGQIFVNVESDGERFAAPIDKVTFQSPQMEEVYRTAGEEFGENGAKAFINGYQEETALPHYAKAFDAYYQSGVTGIPLNQVNTAYMALLPTKVRENVRAAWFAGQNDVNGVSLKNGYVEDAVKKEPVSPNKRKRYPRGVTREYTAKNLTPVQRKQISILDTYGRAHNLSFVFVDTIENGRANGMYKDGVITIALDAEQSGYLVTAGHEAFHYLEKESPAMARELCAYVNAELKKAMGEEEYEILVQKRMGEYGTTNRAQAESEIAANGMFDVFRSETAIQRLVKFNYLMALKVRTALTSFLHELNKILVKLASTDSGRREEIRELRKNNEALKTIATMFDKALQETKGAEDAKKAATDDGGQYSIQSDEHGQYVRVDVDQHIFDGTKRSDWPSIARRYINNHFRGKTLPLGGDDAVRIKTKTSSEYAHPHTQFPAKSSEFEAKMKASTELDNLMEVAEYAFSAEDTKAHKEATFGWDYYAVAFSLGGKHFKGLINIANSEKGRVFYDITKIREIPDTSGEPDTTLAQPSPAFRNLSIDTVSQSDTGVNTSISDEDKKYALKFTQENGDMNALVEKYGAIPPGEKPTREIEVPQRTSDTLKTRRFVRTVLESKHLTDEMVQDVNEKIVKEALSYAPISDKFAIENSESLLQSDMDGAWKRWESVVNGSRIAGKTDIALGEVLLASAAKNEDKRVVMKMVSELCVEATRAGQTTQAFSLLKKMGGIGQLYYVTRTVEKLNRDLESRIQKGKMQKVAIDADLALVLAKSENQQETEMAAADLLYDVAQQMPSTWVDKWNAWRYMAMLCNLRTHIRNIVGNLGFIPAVRLKSMLATGLETVIIHDGEKTSSLYASAENKAFAEKDFEIIQDILLSGGKMNPSDQLRDMKQIFKTQWLETIRKFNGWSLEKEDMWFLKRHYIYAFSHWMQSNGLSKTNIDEKALNRGRLYAVNEAKKATYRDSSAAAQVLSNASKVPGLGIIVDGVMAFKKTPINVLKRGIEYSPVGLLKAITIGMVQLKKEKITINQLIDGIAAGLSGSAVTALGAILYSLGLLIGGFDDDREDELKKLTGEQAYAIRFGDVSYTIDWLAPMSMPLFVGAELAKMMQGKYAGTDGKDWLSSIMTITEPMFNLSMLDGMNRTISATAYSENPLTTILTESALSYGTQGVPTLLGQIARTVDGTRRSIYIDKNSPIPKDVQYAWQRIQNKLPGLTFLSQPYIDNWGNTDETTNVAARAFENFLSPGYISTVKSDEVEKELSALFDATGENAVLPTRQAKYFNIGEERINLTGRQYSTAQTVRGQMAFSIVSQMISKPEYTLLSDTGKAQVIKDAYAFSNALAKAAVSDYAPDGWIKGAYQMNKDYGVPMENLILNRATEYENKKPKESVEYTYRSADVAAALQSGNADAAQKVLNTILLETQKKVMGTNKKEAVQSKISGVKAGLTEAYKADFIKAVQNGDAAERNRIQSLLLSMMANGKSIFSSADFANWIKNAKKVN